MVVLDDRERDGEYTVCFTQMETRIMSTKWTQKKSPF